MTFVFVTFSPTVYGGGSTVVVVYGGGSGELGLIPHVPTYVQYGIFT